MKLWKCAHLTVRLDRPLLMGIINVTPDSFVAASRVADIEHALERAAQMVAAGVDILDVGGESTRPGATPLDATLECDRVVPVIEALHQTFPNVLISVDTYKTRVAKAALEAGAVIVNDVHGCQPDEGMWEFIVQSGAGYVLMHSRGDAQTMDGCCDYTSVVDDVYSTLASAGAQLEALGAAREQIVVDVGFGFAKTAKDCIALMEATERFATLPYGLLAGVSKKRFLSLVDTDEDATVWASKRLIALGTNIVRVHDVEAMARVLG